MGWLSGFLFNPAMAVGAAAVASPILIHILSRRRFKRIRWAAMEFLLDAQRRNRRRVRLEQLILLALRCLAVFLIALMIARPFVRPSLATSLLGAAARTERIILLDDSYSMSYRPRSGVGAGGETTFARATEATEKLIRWLAAESPGDSLTILLTSRPHKPSLALPSLSEENLGRLGRHLKALTPTHGTSAMPSALVAVADLVRRSARQANTAVYVVSDFQQHDWIRAAADDNDNDSNNDNDKPRSVIAPLADLADDSSKLSLALIDVGADAPRNIALIDIATIQPQVVAGVPARFEVAIANHTPDVLRDVELSLSIGRRGPIGIETDSDGTTADADAGLTGIARYALPPVLIPRIQPGQVLREPIEVTLPANGSDFLHVELVGAVGGSDGLVLDNRRAVAVEAEAAIRILIVDGEPHRDPYRDEVFLLRTALRPEGRVASGNEIVVVEEDELDGVELGDYHCVVLANVFRLSKASLRNLEAFTRDGGGVVIFAGDQIDPQVYNEELYDGGRGILPAPLGDVKQTPRSGEPATFGDWDVGRPLLRAFVDDLATILRQVRVYTFIAIDESSPDESTAGAAMSGSTIETRSAGVDGPAPANRPADDRPDAGRAPATVLARLNDPDRSPVMVLRPYGHGQVLFIATSADQEWNDWGGNFSYVPMMLEIMQHMARRSDAPTQTRVGEPINCPIDRSLYKPGAALRTPSYPVEPEISLEAVTDGDGESIVTWPVASKAGLYRFMLSTVTGEPLGRYAAVNPDPAESNLARAGSRALTDTLIEMEFDYIRDLSLFEGESAGARQELWWPLLLAAMVVLMLEHTLAWWFGARR